MTKKVYNSDIELANEIADEEEEQAQDALSTVTPVATTSDDRNGAIMSIAPDFDDHWKQFKEEQTTALVPVDTSFKVSIPENATIEERLMLMDYMGDTEPLWHQVGNVLTFVGMIAIDSFKRDEKGILMLDEEDQLIPCKMSLWRDEEGRVFRAQSMTAYGYLHDKVWPVLGIEGKQGTLLAPLTLRIGQKLTRNKRPTFKFDKVG